MIDLTKGELLAAPTDVWHNVSYTVNHHKWNLLWCRFGENNGRVTSAEVVVASGDKNVVSYYESLGDKPERLDAVLRLTPKHVIDRLVVLLYAIR